MTVDEGFAPDDTTVREISGSISKPVYLIELKISLPLLVNPLNLTLLINKLLVVL